MTTTVNISESSYQMSTPAGEEDRIARTAVRDVINYLHSNKLNTEFALVRVPRDDGIGPEDSRRLLNLLNSESESRTIAIRAFQQLRILITRVVEELPETVISQDIILEEKNIEGGNYVLNLLLM